MLAPSITAVAVGDTLEANSDAPVPWWSFTKTILAAAALVLVARERLQLDEPLRGWPFTLRHLLQHRAGLPDYGGWTAYHTAVAGGGDPWPADELLDRAGAERLLFKPGQGWSYSNIGYLLVRRLVEEASDTPVGTALKELVLMPLGIPGASIAERPTELGATAWGNARHYHPGWVYHGLLVGPAAGAALLLHRLLAGHLLPTPLLDAMRTPLPVCGPIAGRPWLSLRYGLGLADCDAAPGRFLGHTGEGPGSTAAVYSRLPAGDDDRAGRTAAVFAPSDAPGAAEAEAVALASSNNE